MEETLELAINKLAELERKIEKYFQILKVENELDFILKGTYVTDTTLASIIAGTYTVANNE